VLFTALVISNYEWYTSNDRMEFTLTNKLTFAERDIKVLQNKKDDADIEIKRLDCIIEKLKKEKTFKVIATAYTARAKECNKDFKNTAIMEKPRPGYTIAVSQDLMHLLGERVYIKGEGVRRINDLMNKRYKNRIDLLHPTVSGARKFGTQTVIMIVIGDEPSWID
jgi:3D (Asp-Asp-Asp) domain-containing protein